MLAALLNGLLRFPTLFEWGKVMVTTGSIVGKWIKVATTECDKSYPNELEFFETGIYSSTATRKVFSLWQSGDYEIVDRNRIRIQTATDAMLVYNFSISKEGFLIFVDQDGCEFRYERVG